MRKEPSPDAVVVISAADFVGRDGVNNQESVDNVRDCPESHRAGMKDMTRTVVSENGSSERAVQKLARK